MKKHAAIIILFLAGTVCTTLDLCAKDHGPSKGIRNAGAIVGMSLDVVETLASLVSPAPSVAYPAPVVVQPAPTLTVPQVYTPTVAPEVVQQAPSVVVQPAPVVVQPARVYVRPAPRIRLRPVYRRPVPPPRRGPHRR